MMNYTIPVLAAFGVFGILIHNLNNLNKLNRQHDGEINLGKYLKLEVFSILLSFCVVAVCVLGSQEIKQIEQVGKYLGLGFTAIGYMAQSLVISFSNKAEKYIKKQDDNKTDNP